MPPKVFAARESLAQAARLRESGRLHEAIQLLTPLCGYAGPAVDLNEAETEIVRSALLELGDVLWLMDEFEPAVESYERARELGPVDSSRRFRVASRRFESGDFRSTAALLQDEVDLRHDERVLLARCHLKSGRIQDAVSSLEQACRECPDHVDFNYYLGCAYARLGDFDRAERQFSRTIENAPHHPAAYLQRGHVQLMRNKLEAAWDSYQAAEAGGLVEESRAGRECLGALLSKAGKYRQASEVLAPALEPVAGNDAALFHLGLSNLRLRRISECRHAWGLLHERCRHNEVLTEVLSQLDSRSTEIKAVIPAAASRGDRPGADQFDRICADVFRHVRDGAWTKAAATIDQLPRADLCKEKLTSDPELTAALVEVYILAGRRDEGASLYELVQQSNPLDMTAAHGLLVVSFWELENGTNDEQHGDRFVRNAALLLLHEDFWAMWVEARQDTYRCECDERGAPTLRERVEREFLNRFPISSPVGLSLRIELAAARTLADIGGFPRPGGTEEERLTFGPAMLSRLDCTMAFADFVSRFLEEEAAQRDEQRAFAESLRFLDGAGLLGYGGIDMLPWELDLPREGSVLPRYFSQLVAAQVLLEHGRPEDALAALAEAGCPACRHASGTGFTGDEFAISVCRGECRQFDGENPAYAALPDKADRLGRDAVALGCEVLLALAERAMMSSPMDLSGCRQHWLRALQLAAAAGIEAAVSDSISARVLARCNALLSEQDYDGAIDLLECAHEQCVGDSLSDIGVRLAECLNYRSVNRGEADDADWPASEADLRRSLELNPGARVVVSNFVYALMKTSEAAATSEPVAAAGRLIEAHSVVEEAIRDSPYDEQLLYQRSALDQQSAGLADDMLRSADSKADAGDFKAAWALCNSAFELFPAGMEFDAEVTRYALGAVFQHLAEDPQAASRMASDIAARFGGTEEVVPLQVLAYRLA